MTHDHLYFISEFYVYAWISHQWFQSCQWYNIWYCARKKNKNSMFVNKCKLVTVNYKIFEMQNNIFDEETQFLPKE